MSRTTGAASGDKPAVSELARRARLRMLAVMDTEPEPIFDSLARLASAICGTPIALVSLLDGNRQWFKANIGLEGVSQTAQEVAFCAHAIENGDFMEVGDVLADMRFAANPLVTGDPHIRFYAGAPLVMPDGERMGTLCVIDKHSRSLSPAQRDALRELANAVTQALLLRERAFYPEVSSEEGRFKLIAEASPLGIFQADSSGACTYTNPKWREIFGLNEIQSLGHGWRDVIHPADRAEFFRKLKRAAATGGSFDLECRLLRKGGEVVHAHSKMRSISLGDSSQRGFVGSVEDISRRKRAEERLRDSNRFLDRAERISGVGGWEADLQTRTVKWTDQNKKIYEFEPDFEPAFDEHMRYFAENERRIIEETARQSMRTGQPWDLELPMLTAKGRAIWTRSAGVVEYEHGLPVRLVGTMQDITVRKDAEERFKSAAAITRATLESTTDGILVVNDQREIELFNRQFLDMWRIPQGMEKASDMELISVALTQLEDPGSFIRKVEELYQTQATDSFDVLFLKDGRILERYSKPHLIGARAMGRVWSFRDVSAQRAAEAELNKAKVMAEAANRAKSTFLATMSHEIRTPLNGILGITNLLLDETLSAQQRQFAKLIDGSAQSLLVLVNDFLDLAKIEAGQTVLDVLPFNLHRLMAEMAELFTYRASAKSLVFHHHIDSQVPQWVWGDVTRLRQILTNLLGNALKFTHAGEFSLQVSSTHEPSAGGEQTTLRFTVADTGIGISAEVQEKLFQNFVQADTSTTRQYGGTGLGLALVKRLSELMGGKVELNSSLQKGSTFTIVLPGVRHAPAPLAAGQFATASPDIRQRTERILLVEDNPTNQIVAVGLLKKSGFGNVVVAANGQEAITRVAESAQADVFAAILMDCQMPVMDGYTATQALHSMGCRIPVIAMTANAMEGDVEKCLNAGMNDYLAKPVTLAALQQALARWIAEPAAIGAASAGATAGDTESAKAAFDVVSALDRLGDDRELLQQVVQSFTSRLPLVLQEIDQALQAQDMELLARHLHSMTGVAGAVSADAVKQAVLNMEACVKNNDVANANFAWPGLQLRLNEFVAAAKLAGF